MKPKAERVYTLSNRRDLDSIVIDLVLMAPNATLTFLLSEIPLTREIGKISFKTGSKRKIDDFLYLEIQNNSEVLRLHAITSHEDQDDDTDA